MTDRKDLHSKFLNFSPKKGDLRKAELLEATIYCLAHLGIENTTFESIGKRCHMKKTHVAYYFPDKADLVEAAIKFVVAHVQDITVEFVSQSEKPTSVLKAFVEGTFHWVASYPDEPRVILLMYYYSTISPSYKKLHDQVRQLGAKRLSAILKNISPKSASNTCLEGGKHIQALLTGYLVEYLTTETKHSASYYSQKTWREISEYLINRSFTKSR